MKIFFLSGFLLSISLIACAQQSADSVTVIFEVRVPPSTPKNARLFWTGSLNHWDPGNKGTGLGAKEYAKPMQKENGSWQIKLSSSKGDTVQYKYARGTIFSAEEKADFSYRQIRRVIFDAPKTVRDTVAAWHDRPPKSLQDKWPVIHLKRTKKAITYGGQLMDGSGTILYDKAMGSHFFDVNNFNTQTKGIPEIIGEHVFYFLKVSDAPDNTILILAGKTSPDGAWNVYIDQNNNNAIDADELAFTIQSDTVLNEWTGKVQIQKLDGKNPVSGSVKLTIDHATNLPKGYTSSVNPEAPDLAYRIPFRQRKATLNENSFYLTTPFLTNFSSYFYLSEDKDRNDSLEIGSGSNETSTINLGQMFRQQKFYIYPVFQLGKNFWEVATVDPKGTSIRLRPAKKFKAKASIAEGKPVPSWEATTTNNKQISSASLQGKYVLMDFWGSWCGPCRQEIPTLKKAYNTFKIKNFELVGFAYDSPAAFNKAMELYHLPWPQILDDEGKYSTNFIIRGYPSHLLIGPDGKILEINAANLYGKKLIPTLEKYLK